MTWAVRGCSGFGGPDGCLFAGIMWGAAWWFIARDPDGRQSRRYTSGWIIPAVAFGVAYSGNRGWMQWPHFFDGQLATNFGAGKSVPISRNYGFLWMFIAGVPWAGLGACLLAWCGSARPLGLVGWCVRLACGISGAALATQLFKHLPHVFLPLYDIHASLYADTHTNPNLRRLINDNRAAMQHLGLYLGFLAFELGRRDWKNATLILTVGLVNGAGWAAFQNWSWAPRVWATGQFNWWRCWESSGGISIGVAFGIAYFLVNRPATSTAAVAGEPDMVSQHPNLERFAAYSGLLAGLGWSVKNGMKGWANIYLGHEDYWNAIFTRVMGPLIWLGLLAIALWIWRKRLPRGFKGDVFPHAHKLIWLVLIVQNLIAQFITGPWSEWREVAFSIYYALLFMVSGVIVYYFHVRKTLLARGV